MEVKYEHRLTELEEKWKSAHREIGELRQEVHDIKSLAESVATLATNQGNMKEQLDKVSENVETIMMQPAKSWDALVASILTGIVGIMLGALFRGM